MTPAEAARIVDTVMAAWEWEMEAETLAVWSRAIESLQDPEAVDQAVVDLYMGRTRKHGRPIPGDVAEQYQAVLRRWASEKRVEQVVAELPVPEFPDHVPAEVRAFVGDLHGKGLRRGELVRAVLRSKGVAAPVDVRHADAHDPPLTELEQRHPIHMFQRKTVEGCRFCAADASSEHDARTDEGGTA